MTIRELIDLLSEHQYPDNEVIVFFDEKEHTVATAALITGGVENNNKTQFLMWLIDTEAEIVL